MVCDEASGQGQAKRGADSGGGLECHAERPGHQVGAMEVSKGVPGSALSLRTSVVAPGKRDQRGGKTRGRGPREDPVSLHR